MIPIASKRFGFYWDLLPPTVPNCFNIKRKADVHLLGMKQSELA